MVLFAVCAEGNVGEKMKTNYKQLGSKKKARKAAYEDRKKEKMERIKAMSILNSDPLSLLENKIMLERALKNRNPWPLW